LQKWIDRQSQNRNEKPARVGHREETGRTGWKGILIESGGLFQNLAKDFEQNIRILIEKPQKGQFIGRKSSNRFARAGD